MSEPASGRNYTVQTKINRPVAEVFAAIVDSQLLSKYFIDRADGPLVEGRRVIWHWKQYGDFPVVVTKLTANQLIELELDTLEWEKTGPEEEVCKIVVSMEMEALDDASTMLSISERGWKTDASGLKASHENCSGWTHMAMCLKAYLEHGLDLR